jgi:hypothetical protein
VLFFCESIALPFQPFEAYLKLSPKTVDLSARQIQTLTSYDTADTEFLCVSLTIVFIHLSAGEQRQDVSPLYFLLPKASAVQCVWNPLFGTARSRNYSRASCQGANSTKYFTQQMSGEVGFKKPKETALSTYVYTRGLLESQKLLRTRPKPRRAIVATNLKWKWYG